MVKTMVFVDGKIKHMIGTVPILMLLELVECIKQRNDIMQNSLEIQYTLRIFTKNVGIKIGLPL